MLIRKIAENQLTSSLFQFFNRYQEVKRCWRKENGQWILKNIAFTEAWGDKELIFLIECLQNTLKSGGIVLGAFENEMLIGFASIESFAFGSENQYRQLSSLHISHESRGNGHGAELFSAAAKNAKQLGATKLYISGHSSEETQRFYKKMGCVEAKEYNVDLVAKEPCDCQLEYLLIDNFSKDI